MLVPWLLVAFTAFTLWRFVRDYESGRAVPLILIYDGVALVSFFLWARAANGVWPEWGYNTTIVLWFVVGVGAIVWTVLAMSAGSDGNVPPARQHERESTAARGDNFVAASHTETAGYVWRGSRAQRRRRK